MATSIDAVKAALVDAGAVPRCWRARLGSYTAAGGETIEADASLENSAPVLFDALVLPDGEAGVEALAKDGQTMEFVVNQYRHCKTILALGASQHAARQGRHLGDAAVGRRRPGPVPGRQGSASTVAADFIAAIGRHRHPERDLDPPLI